MNSSVIFNFENKRQIEILSMTFDNSTTTQEWQKLLNEIAQIHGGERLKISEKLVMFKEQSVKRSWKAMTKELVAIGKKKQQMTEKEVEMELKNWSQGITIASFISNIMRGSGTLAIFTNCLLSASEQQILKDGEQVPWHTYVVFYRDGVIGVYDPSFSHSVDRPKLKNQKGVPLLSYFITMLRIKGSRFRLSSLWFGGGGNDGTMCQEMSRRWVFEEVCVKGGRDLGS